jgi:uncharacterized metal-binding protein
MPDSLLHLTTLDPAPLFAASLIPYLVFLWFAGRTPLMPKLSRLGFQLTILFVLVTILAALWALIRFDSELVQIDWLHGGAEAFLTLSNGLILAGLLQRHDQLKGTPSGE